MNTPRFISRNQIYTSREFNEFSDSLSKQLLDDVRSRVSLLLSVEVESWPGCRGPHEGLEGCEMLSSVPRSSISK